MDGERRTGGPAAVRGARPRLRGALPAIAGLLAAAATFAVVAPITGGDDPEPAVAPVASVAPVAAPQSADQVAAGRLVFARMGCGSCHELAAANARGQIGPSLDQRLPGHTRESLTLRIVDPYRDGPPSSFYAMPENFGERMSKAELDALVAFLLCASAGRCGAE